MTFNVKCLEDKLKCRIFVVRLGMSKKKGATPFLLSVSLQTTKTIRFVSFATLKTIFFVLPFRLSP